MSRIVLGHVPRVTEAAEFLESIPGSLYSLSHLHAHPGTRDFCTISDQGGMAHLGLDASSPSRCSSCSGPPRSASPGTAGARCALRTGGSCNSGSVQWLPCRTGPRACRETERGGMRPGKTRTHPEGNWSHPPTCQGRFCSYEDQDNGDQELWQAAESSSASGLHQVLFSVPDPPGNLETPLMEKLGPLE